MSRRIHQYMLQKALNYGVYMRVVKVSQTREVPHILTRRRNRLQKLECWTSRTPPGVYRYVKAREEKKISGFMNHEYF